MKNFLIGVVSGFLFAGLAAVILFFVAVRVAASFGEKNTKVADNSTLILKLEGAVPEKPPTEFPIPFLQDQTPLSMPQIWEMLHKASTDNKVKAILIEPHSLAAGFSQLQEIRQLLVDFKKSGKPLIAFLRNPGTREYYLASAADKIYLTPEDSLDLKGIHLEPLFLKGALDKLGVRMDVVHAGKYKDAGDMFTQTTMTPETREVLNNVLDQLYGDMVATIASGRKKTPEEVKAIIDQGPFMADAAKANGLIDTLAYEDQVADEVAKSLGQKALVKLSQKTYANTPGPTGKRIALIVGQGEILRGSGNSAFGEQDGIISEPFMKLIRDVENDSSIKGAILRVDSPGGDGIASDDILHEAKNLSKKKPLVISMGDLAASGGYFISMTGDPIVAYPNTITGSIGVIFMKPNLHGLYDKLGIQKDILQRGRYSDLDSDYVQMTDDEQAKIRTQIDQFYKVFVSRVADGRKKPFDQIQELAQGRVWMGAQAKQNGLVDELGGLDKAIEMVKKKAGIGANENITLVTYPGKKTIFDLMNKASDDNPAIDMRIKKLLGNVPLGTWKRGGFVKLMPIMIDVR
jgi:protease-4